MADGTVGLLPDSTGKKVDVTELTVAGNTVERQRVNISSPTDPNAHAEVMGEPPPNPDSTFALLVRQIQEDNAYTQELLGQIATALSIAAAPVSIGGGWYRGLKVVSDNLSTFQATAYMTFQSGAYPSPAASAAPWQGNALPVAFNQNFPSMNLPPQHIYGGISV